MKKYLIPLFISLCIGFLTVIYVSELVENKLSNTGFFTLSLIFGTLFFILLVIRIEIGDIKRMLKNKEKDK
jgi:uncharacterized membrane protein